MFVSNKVKYEMSGAKFSVRRDNERYIFTGDFSVDDENHAYDVYNSHGNKVLSVSWDEGYEITSNEISELVSSTLNALGTTLEL